MKTLLKSAGMILTILFLTNSLHAQIYADPTKVPQDGKAPGLKFKLLSETKDTKTYMLVFAKGDEVVAGITEFAKKNNIKSASYSGLGDALAIKVGWFNYTEKKFKVINVDTAEITSLKGHIAWFKGKPVAHTHLSAAIEDGSVKGGHLLELISGPTVEIVLTTQPITLYKKLDPEYDAALIDFDIKGNK
ncbi:PPC domain-containing DNA-binding protein [Pedobacter mucosus]|uniref:PPC domain-containing DNA-binding protein n=1 Tax=Pedobacter mucosus TaxID=2895286 RepID=UPI001EE4C341|nr:PPC domain-containing DNA-binding protein [Pedobacter mucosus]UKT66004.1 DNA-binding protein [Pedobacter mucosus]